MNRQDAKTLKYINAEMERRNLDARFEAHPHYPLKHALLCKIDEKRMVRVHLGFRKADYFFYDGPDTCFGSSIAFGGPFKGRGWREKLAHAAANAFETYAL